MPGARFPVRWCIGCGAIENLEPYLGPCDERKLEIVRADEHEEVLARVDQGREAPFLARHGIGDAIGWPEREGLRVDVDLSERLEDTSGAAAGGR